MKNYSENTEYNVCIYCNEKDGNKSLKKYNKK